MVSVLRYKHNPIIKPNKNNQWESLASFNGCTIKDNGKFHIVYRALSNTIHHRGAWMNLSSIGYASCKDGFNFVGRKLLVKPDIEWDMFGCEDPRITKMDGKYFIFYTGISTWPPTPAGIKIGVAVTKDFNDIEKHGVTFFNSKAMAMFPDKVGGKIFGILTVHTDLPPSKICIVSFDNEEQIWSKSFWKEWYSRLDEHVAPLQRGPADQVEIGAPPVKTKDGWLLIYSYIKNYLSPPPTFGVEAVLLDLKDPKKVVGRLEEPLLVPIAEYELYGNVPNIVFPSGALAQNGQLLIYYGGADTSCCVAICDLKELLEGIKK